MSSMRFAPSGAHTTIPVPKPLDLVHEIVPSGHGLGAPSTRHKAYLLMTIITGASLSHCIDAIPNHDYPRIVLQLRDAVEQLRHTPKDVNPSAAICNAGTRAPATSPRSARSRTRPASASDCASPPTRGAAATGSSSPTRT
ncbi:Protein kinase-like domain protein [Cordyceps fumosorosea ARSEF 2679]|uniref:Protein kinase-like domain protein n=1 Tax=Cordyceps fumosorosea (strain ARSEF 2679) TaxID=1081104 RepID=A0A162MM78_CORFA|nr:Protein kinase-like domain protein [Cordyceps fumosorosea ARSEF 2679]OAA64040.1 Protein kinase-like domain protein [Cordyceps fumosorosea ARSEF 2679]